ncbi:MAG TPA: AraC family transcriptional regulator [Solirubrobacteraceae bacterium]|nr:AraC family transcriptional regulator [Solirubrobacteraceae bacterium]
MNASDAQIDVQSSHGLDLIGDAVAAMRTGQPQVARALLHAPWGLRFPAAGAIGVQIILKGGAWLTGPGGGDPIALGAGDIALIRRRAPHALADDPATPLWDVDYSAHVPADHWPADGSALDPATGGTVLMGGTYDLAGARAHPLFADLPDVVHLPARVGVTTGVRAVVDLLGAELDRDLPGTSAATPALLDLLLLYALRAWFEAPEAPSGWARASRDPELSVALRLIHDHPQHPWTVAELATRSNLSRAALARRFTALTGQPPLTHLTWWRMTLAARMLRTGSDSLSTIAERIGYGNEYAFSKAFRRELGVAPSRYRAEAQ